MRISPRRSSLTSAGLRRGVSFGNALDGARAAPARLLLLERYFDAVSDAGFDLLRLPVRWSAWADESVPYSIAPDFGERVDRAVSSALDRDLTVVLDVHHYDELQRAPDEHEDRFVALWQQIANPLPALELPADSHLLGTVHYYEPMTFTHQGASWTPGTDRWRGTTWGSDADHDAVRGDLARADAWARQNGVPLLIGEFGTYDRADLASRVAWTRCVRSQAERLGLSWCYWDFGTDFGVYEPESRSWKEPLRSALLDG